MKYFEKINLDLSDVDIDKIRGGTLQEGYGEAFRSYNMLDSEYFYNIYSTRIKFKIPPDFVNYTEITNFGAGPHCDGAKAVLNYYVDTASAVTMFWVPKDPERSAENYDRLDENGNWHKSNVLLYTEDQLKVAGYFFAKPHSAYVLRTSSIHSVQKPNVSTTRKFFRWLWMDLEFEELLENIETVL